MTDKIDEDIFSLIEGGQSLDLFTEGSQVVSETMSSVTPSAAPVMSSEISATPIVDNRTATQKQWEIDYQKRVALHTSPEARSAALISEQRKVYTPTRGHQQPGKFDIPGADIVKAGIKKGFEKGKEVFDYVKETGRSTFFPTDEEKWSRGRDAGYGKKGYVDKYNMFEQGTFGKGALSGEQIIFTLG